MNQSQDGRKHNPFKVDEVYLANLRAYSGKDGAKALLMYGINLILYFILGIILIYGTAIPLEFLRYMDPIITVVAILCCLAFVLVAKEAFSTVGIALRNWRQSLLLGIVAAVLVSALNVILALAGGARTFNGEGLGALAIAFFLPACAEELIFRGYIQPRLGGLIKKEWVAVIVLGLLFVLSHWPVKLVASGFDVIALLEDYTLWIRLFLLHVACVLVRRKYNSLIAPILLHFFHNLSLSLFV